MRGLQRRISGKAPGVAGYITFAIAAALAVFMIVVWVVQRVKRRGTQGGRRY
jgi:hypothetical protein